MKFNSNELEQINQIDRKSQLQLFNHAALKGQGQTLQNDGRSIN